MQFSIAGAARLYGKQRKTLYRHMEAGRLSYQVLGSGRRVVDLSELIRVYGEPPGKGNRNDTLPEEVVTQGREALLWQAMLDELRGLRQEVAELKQQLALPPPERPKPLPVPSTNPDEKVRSMEDVLARFESRQR